MFHFTNFESCGSLEGKVRFFNPLGFEIRSAFDKNPKKLSVRQAELSYDI